MGENKLEDTQYSIKSTYMIEMFDDVSGQRILGSDEDLDDFVEVERTDVKDINNPREHSEIVKHADIKTNLRE